MIRHPSVADSFYPGRSSILQIELDNYMGKSAERKKVIGLISPHAGYVYSGSCAGKAFGQVEIPSTVIILGINHRERGVPFSISGHDHWRTPLGDVPIDHQLRDQLLARSTLFTMETDAGLQEHSLEVQIPFIQHLNPQAKILPIMVSSHQAPTLLKAGEEIAGIIADNPDVLIVASTDMSHFLTADQASVLDRKAIQHIKQLDPQRLLETVQNNRITMCGVAPTTLMLATAKRLGATITKEVDYTHSGVVSGDMSNVVAYLSLLVY